MTSKSIRRTATVPYLFIQGCRFMRVISSASDESKEVARIHFPILAHVHQTRIVRRACCGIDVMGGFGHNAPGRLTAAETAAAPASRFAPCKRRIAPGIPAYDAFLASSTVNEVCADRDQQHRPENVCANRGTDHRQNQSPPTRSGLARMTDYRRARQRFLCRRARRLETRPSP
jgi:hypothetical protein